VRVDLLLLLLLLQIVVIQLIIISYSKIFNSSLSLNAFLFILGHRRFVKPYEVVRTSFEIRHAFLERHNSFNDTRE